MHEQYSGETPALEHLVRKLHNLEDELKEAKSRLSKQHDELIKRSYDTSKQFGVLNHDLRTALNCITGALHLIEQTKLTTEQHELIELVGESADILLQIVEKTAESSGSTMSANQSIDASPPTVAKSSEILETTSGVALKDARILVVHGLVGSAELVETYATASGMNCQAASRGYSGLTALKQAARAGRSFNVVFVEKVLPDMDGFEFCRIVKNDRQIANTPIVLVSSFGAEPSGDRVIPAGFLAHIAKPGKQAQVITTVQNVLDGSYLSTAPKLPVDNETPPELPIIGSGARVILVAEDNRVNQKLSSLQLQELGFFAEIVNNGKEAVEAAKQIQFDAILMDCQMPEMDGFQATKEIRQWERNAQRHVPIIAMTAFADAADRTKCLAAGMDDYLSKPIAPEQLQSILNKWLSAEYAYEGTMDKTSGDDMNFNPEGTKMPTEPIDFPALIDMLGEEEALSILKLFVESTEELLQKIEGGVSQQDLHAVKEAAHTLKGACSSIGANIMWQSCIELEKAAKASDWAHIPQHLNQVEQDFQQAKTFIDGTSDSGRAL